MGGRARCARLRPARPRCPGRPRRPRRWEGVRAALASALLGLAALAAPAAAAARPTDPPGVDDGGLRYDVAEAAPLDTAHFRIHYVADPTSEDAPDLTDVAGGL